MSFPSFEYSPYVLPHPLSTSADTTSQLFVLRVEAQLTGSDGLKIRETINSNYDRISSTMFEALQQMAKMSGEGASAEDKDQLNYYVIIIGSFLFPLTTASEEADAVSSENMHHLVSSFSKDQVPALASFVDQAREKYQENLNLYIKLVLRRPLARLLVRPSSDHPDRS